MTREYQRVAQIQAAAAEAPRLVRLPISLRQQVSLFSAENPQILSAREILLER